LPDSIREQILTAIATRAALITVANGYNTDLGLSISRHVRRVDEPDLPAMLVKDGDESGETSHYGIIITVMEVSLIGGINAQDDGEQSTLMSGMFADFMLNILSEDTDLGGLVDSITFARNEPKYPVSGQLKAIIEAETVFNVTYQISNNDPYTQP